MLFEESEKRFVPPVFIKENKGKKKKSFHISTGS